MRGKGEHGGVNFVGEGWEEECDTTGSQGRMRDTYRNLSDSHMRTLRSDLCQMLHWPSFHFQGFFFYTFVAYWWLNNCWNTRLPPPVGALGAFQDKQKAKDGLSSSLCSYLQEITDVRFYFETLQESQISNGEHSKFLQTTADAHGGKVWGCARHVDVTDVAVWRFLMKSSRAVLLGRRREPHTERPERRAGCSEECWGGARTRVRAARTAAPESNTANCNATSQIRYALIKILLWFQDSDFCPQISNSFLKMLKFYSQNFDFLSWTFGLLSQNSNFLKKIKISTFSQNSDIFFLKFLLFCGISTIFPEFLLFSPSEFRISFLKT